MVTFPNVVDVILPNGIFSHYNHPRIAQLCEKVGLYMRALQASDLLGVHLSFNIDLIFCMKYCLYEFLWKSFLGLLHFSLCQMVSWERRRISMLKLLKRIICLRKFNFLHNGVF